MSGPPPGPQWPRVSKTNPSASRFKLAASGCTTRRELRLDIRCGNQISGIGRIQSRLNLLTKPDLMVGRCLLLQNKFTHEITEQLCTAAIPPFGRQGELFFQRFLDPKSKRCITHSSPMCYKESTW